MSMQGDGWSVERDQGTVTLSGKFRLGGGPDYAPILDFLKGAFQEAEGGLTVDIRPLELLNSSGITMLSRFVMACRGSDKGLTILAAPAVPWQAKTLRNLGRLLPTIDIREDA